MLHVCLWQKSMFYVFMNCESAGRALDLVRILPAIIVKEAVIYHTQNLISCPPKSGLSWQARLCHLESGIHIKDSIASPFKLISKMDFTSKIEDNSKMSS